MADSIEVTGIINMTNTIPPSQDDQIPTEVSGAFVVLGDYDAGRKLAVKVQVEIVHPIAGNFDQPPMPGPQPSSWSVNFDALPPTPEGRPATLVANLYNASGNFLVGSTTYYLEVT